MCMVNCLTGHWWQMAFVAAKLIMPIAEILSCERRKRYFYEYSLPELWTFCGRCGQLLPSLRDIFDRAFRVRCSGPEIRGQPGNGCRFVEEFFRSVFQNRLYLFGLFFRFGNSFGDFLAFQVRWVILRKNAGDAGTTITGT